MLEALGNSVECLVCMEVMVSAIKQCDRGHSICGNCANKLYSCPLCKSAISTRNYKLEDVIAVLREMDYAATRCKEKFGKNSPVLHSNYGRDDLYRYVANNHTCTQIKLQTWSTLRIDQETKDYFDIQLIPYKDGNELFWYINKINVQKNEVSWLFQYLEPKVQTNNYYYELTLSHGSLSRTMMMWELCESDKISMDDLIEAGKCITIPFKVLNKYIRDDRKIYFKFNIVEKKVTSENSDQRVNQPMGVFSKDDQILPPYRELTNCVDNPLQTSQMHELSQLPLISRDGPVSASNQNQLVDRHKTRGWGFLPPYANVHDQHFIPHQPMPGFIAYENYEHNTNTNNYCLVPGPRQLPPVSNNCCNQITSPNSSGNQQIPHCPTSGATTNNNNNFSVQNFRISGLQSFSNTPTFAENEKPTIRRSIPSRMSQRGCGRRYRCPVSRNSCNSTTHHNMPFELLAEKHKHFQDSSSERHDTVIDLTVNY